MKKFLLPMMLLIISVFISACGNSSDAKETKGEIDVYTHNDSEEMQDLVKGLEEETGIELNVLRTSSGEGWSRMQSESPDFGADMQWGMLDRKSTRLNSSHVSISYAVFCLKKKKELI